MIKKVVLLTLSAWISQSQAAETAPNQSLDDLLEMPLEQLMALNLNTSVGKKEQSVKNSAAAVFVISQEDIRRSGWKPFKNLDLSLVGQNLFDHRHLEFGNTVSELPMVYIQRSLFGKVSVSF